MSISAAASRLSRRQMLNGIASISAGLLLGCGRSQAPGGSEVASQPAAADARSPTSSQMAVYRDSSCGCCAKWAEIAQAAGFQVAVTDHPDIQAFKRERGLPQQLAACHTTLVGGYIVEGHVPLAAVQRLLAEKPKIMGIAVPGMPVGSPGMEAPDGAEQPFEVLAFDAGGKVVTFAA